MELHLSVIVVVVHTEDLVVGQYVEQLPLSLVHEDALVLPELLGASHQGDVNVINYRSNKMMRAAWNSHGNKLPFPPPTTLLSEHRSQQERNHDVQTWTDVLPKSWWEELRESCYCQGIFIILLELHKSGSDLSHGESCELPSWTLHLSVSQGPSWTPAQRCY